MEDKDKKEDLLKSKGYQYDSTSEAWIKETKRISRDFLEIYSFTTVNLIL